MNPLIADPVQSIEVNLWHELTSDLTKELGGDLSTYYVESLKHATHNDLGKAKTISYNCGKSWAPLLLHWQNWVVETTRTEAPPVLFMRDCKVLEKMPDAKEWPKVWLNRSLLGIADEISGENEQRHTLVKDYAKQHKMDNDFTFVDTGCWGSMVKDLAYHYGMSFDVRFFFSHNPYIPGFLNKAGIDEKTGELLNDSLESAFINPYSRVSQLQKNAEGVIRPVVSPLGQLSQELGRSALEGLNEAIGSLTSSKELPSIASCVEELVSLSNKAKNGHFTGMLPQNTETWSRGEQFLQDWPKHLNFNF